MAAARCLQTLKKAAKVSQAAAGENTVDVGEVELFSELSGIFRVSLFKLHFLWFRPAPKHCDLPPGSMLPIVRALGCHYQAELTCLTKATILAISIILEVSGG